MFIKKGKTNIKYLLIVVVLAAIVGGGTLWFSEFSEMKEREASLVGFTEIKRPEKIENNKTETAKDGEKKLIDDIVLIRYLDKELIRQKIEQGKEYLFRVIDEDEHGVHKYYYALDDSFENRLHTIYTSSVIYSLLKIYDFEKDSNPPTVPPAKGGAPEKTWQYISDSSEFILSMQNRDKESKRYGAFYYSYYLDNKEKEKKFVVGTASKTIFTLLELCHRTGDFKYLESAKLAGDWLITMQKSDGSIKPYVRYNDGKWFYGTKESLLYNGQVLSALSRIYKITKEEKYYDVAEKIASRLTQKVEKEGCYLGDDYRMKNPISSSWVILSLLDFYKINREENYKNIVFNCSDELLERQIKDQDDLFHYGGWQGAYSTSGNGWLNEVMVEIYKFCEEQNKEGCDKYKKAIIRVTRWLIQNTYSEENSFFLKNPERAIGGLFWNQENKYVRTDSVCHGLNAYVEIVDELEDGLLLSLPEKPLEEILNK